jgi:hypothetical protein
MRFSLTPDWISSRSHRNPSHSISVAGFFSHGISDDGGRDEFEES